MSDIVGRLMTPQRIDAFALSDMMREAADEITALRARVAELEKALEDFGHHAESCQSHIALDLPCDCGLRAILKGN